MRARLVKESLDDLLIPKSKEDIIKELSKLSQYKKNVKLISAAVKGQLEIIKLLINADVNINKAIYGYIALISASKNGHLDIVKLLIEAGADVNAKNKRGDTALVFAFMNNNLDIINLLKKYGAKE